MLEEAVESVDGCSKPGCGWPACGSVLVVDLRKHESPTSKAGTVVVLGSDRDTDLVDQLLATGAEASAIARPHGDRLVRALSSAASHPPDPHETNGSAPLTPREREILDLIVLGHTSPEIAEQLVISVRTVEAHRRNIVAKTGRRTRADLVALGLGEGPAEA